ncbi:hypothetical protein ACOMHN_025047 [Nucella lapillus]
MSPSQIYHQAKRTASVAVAAFRSGNCCQSTVNLQPCDGRSGQCVVSVQGSSTGPAPLSSMAVTLWAEVTVLSSLSIKLTTNVLLPLASFSGQSASGELGFRGNRRHIKRTDR